MLTSLHRSGMISRLPSMRMFMPDEDTGGGSGSGSGSGSGDGIEGASDAGTGGDGTEGKGDAGTGGDGTDGIELDKLPKDVQDLVKRYRKEAAEASGKARDKARADAATAARDEVLKDIGVKLGFIKSESDKLSPEEFATKLAEVAGQRDAAQTDATTTKIELAVYRSASKNGGDPEALLDSRTFLAKVGKLDPTLSDFSDKVAAAIKDAVKDNPKLKAPQAGASSSSADHGASSSSDGGERKVKPLDQAVSGHYGS